MYPPEPNTNAETSSNDCGTSRFKMPHAASDEKNGPSTNSSYRSNSNPLAPLLPSSLYDPAIPDMDPPSYSSVVAQDSNDWKNRSVSFSPHINGGKSTLDLDNQAPYTLRPGPTNQPSYLTSDFLADGILAIKMPASIKTERSIDFTEVVTSQPKSANLGSSFGEYGSTMTDSDSDSMDSSSKLIVPTISAQVFRSTMGYPEDNPAQEESLKLACYFCCRECLLCHCECIAWCLESILDHD